MAEKLGEQRFIDIPLQIPHELRYRYEKGRGNDDDRIDLIFHHQVNFEILLTKAEIEVINKDAEVSRNFYKLALEAYSRKGEFYLSSASEYITKSITFAPIGSEQLWLGYANRSAILMEARMYKDALGDIRRAFEAGCAEKIHAKLFIRKAMCLRALKSKSKGGSKEALRKARECLEKMDKADENYQKTLDMLNEYSMQQKSFGKPRVKWDDKKYLPELTDKNPEILGATNAIEIKYKKGQGQYVVAARDIEPGEVFYTGVPFVSALVKTRRYLCCWHCLQQCWAGIPCDCCPHVIFCSEKCRDDAWSDYHCYEGPLLGSLLGPSFSTADFLAIKIFLKAFIAAGSFLNLRMQVETLKSPKTAGPRQKGFTGNVFDGSRYDSVHSMKGVYIKSQEYLYSIDMLVTYLLILFATRTELFGEKMSVDEMCDHEWSTFAGSLLLKHIMIARFNSFCVIDIESIEDERMAKARNLSLERNAAILPMYSIIRSSCNANVCENTYGNIVTLFSNVFIKKGEELFLCWIHQYDVVPKEKRQSNYSQIFGESCKCIACKQNWPLYNDIPTYSEKLSSKEVIEMLNSEVLVKNVEYAGVVEDGNIEEVLEIFGDITRILKLLQDNVTPPCKDLIRLSTTLMNSRRLLGSRHQSLEGEPVNRRPGEIPNLYLEDDSADERESINEFFEDTDSGTEV